MWHNISFALWFLLPAAVANAAPIAAVKLPGLRRFDAPLDGGMTFHGREIFGPHKTWRGLMAGIIVATAVLYGQQLLYPFVSWAQYAANGIDYTQLPTLLLGPLFAIGALGGDAVESFFKRRLGIQSGRSWVPFDQLDYIIGSVIVSLPFVRAEPVQYLWMFIVWFLAHLLATYLGYRVGLRNDPI